MKRLMKFTICIKGSERRYPSQNTETIFQRHSKNDFQNWGNATRNPNHPRINSDPSITWI